MTTIPVVLAALTTLAGSTLSGWQAINGPADAVTTTEDKLALIGDEEVVAERHFNNMTFATTGESYAVPVALSVDLQTTDQQVADAAALAGYDLLEAAIREFPGGADLGLSAQGVQEAIPTGDFRLLRLPSADGRNALVRFYVQVRAQNT